MAVSGLLFVLFLLAHMYGNLKMFAGAETFDHYAAWMRTIGQPALPYSGMLWILRVVLAVAIIAHVYSAVRLWMRANAARGRAYKVNTGSKVTASYSYTASLMRWGGIALGLFIIFHLLHFTTLTFQIGADYDAIGPYARMIASFQPEYWWVYLIYLVATCSLALHVRHGVWSALVTLGLSRTSRERVYKIIADLCGLALVLGFMAAPTAILFGLIS